MNLVILAPLKISFDVALQKEGLRLMERVQKSFTLLQKHNKIPLKTAIENMEIAISDLVTLKNYLKIYVGKKLL